MAESEIPQEVLDRVRIIQDIHMAALSLNSAVKNYQRAGGSLTANPLMGRMLASTELFLKEQETKAKSSRWIPPTCPDCGHTVCLCHTHKRSKT